MIPRLPTYLAVLLLPLCPVVAAEPFPLDSPEHQALTAASTSLGDEEFTLREEYWKGALTPTSGRAMRLQLFKRNHYRLFFGVSPTALPKGGKLHLRIVDSANETVAEAAGASGEAALSLVLEEAPKTALYLVLMRVEAPPTGPLADLEIPAALFYGWK